VAGTMAVDIMAAGIMVDTTAAGIMGVGTTSVAGMEEVGTVVAGMERRLRLRMRAQMGSWPLWMALGQALLVIAETAPNKKPTRLARLGFERFLFDHVMSDREAL
jgi:hypothetical protein